MSVLGVSGIWNTYGLATGSATVTGAITAARHSGVDYFSFEDDNIQRARLVNGAASLATSMPLMLWNNNTIVGAYTGIGFSVGASSVPSASNTQSAYWFLDAVNSRLTMADGAGNVACYFDTINRNLHCNFGVEASTAAIGPLYVTASSVTVTGSSGLAVTGTQDGSIAFTIAGSTYGVISSSFQIATGHLLISNSTSYTVGDGGTSSGGSSGSSIYAATATASFPFGFSASTGAFTASGTSTNSKGVVDVYKNASMGDVLFSVGSNQQNDQFLIKDQTALGLGTYGARIGTLNIGLASFSDKVMSANAASQHINYWNSGEMDLQTSNVSDGGTQTNSIVLKPNEIAALTVSSLSVTANSPFAVLNSGATLYDVSLSTTSTFYQVQVSTNGHMLYGGPVPAVSSCGVSPSVTGNDSVGIISVGSGVTTSCTLTFASTYGVGCNVVCVSADNSTATTGDVSAISPTAVTFSFSATIGSGLVYYQCRGFGSACK